MITKKYKYFVFPIVLLALSGCLGTKHLKENEKMLLRQSISAPKNISTDALRDLYLHRPNRRLLSVLPVHHLVLVYYWGERNYDQEKYIQKKQKFEKKFDAKISKATSQKKINNYQFRKQKKMEKYQAFIDEGNMRMRWGEPIAVYDSTKVALTEERFRQYLASEGYFLNSVTSKANTRIGEKFATVTYKVNPGIPYVIDSIFYQIKDTAIHKIVLENTAESFIKKGDRQVQDKLSSERERIDYLLKDNGYYDFSRQYIDFSIDTTTLGNRKTMVMMAISDPLKRGYHKRFIVDSVKFITDANLKYAHKRQSRMYKDIQYSYFNDNYNLKILTQRVFVHPNTMYSRTNTQRSQHQLANLDAFKFVDINYDTSRNKFIATIFTRALDRYEWSNEVGVNVTQGYPGPFYNLNLKKRNIFKGLENFEFNGRIGFEGVASATEELNVYKSTEAGVNASLIFPQFLWPLREKAQFKVARFNPKTRLSLGYAYTDRPEYRRTNTSLTGTYTWQKQKTQYSFGLVNLSLIDSDLDSAFVSLLDTLEAQGNNLKQSFLPSFVSSTTLSVTWNRNYGIAGKNSVFVRAQIEAGGTFLNLIDTYFITDQGLQYFKYLRFNLDFRRTRILSKWATLAYHFNTGIAYSYGPDQALPYEKYFFAGGSNSIRAWRPRRLGQGSVPPAQSEDKRADGEFDYQFERPGEILLEGSIELRSKIIGFIDGAVFLDAGNVWARTRTTTQAGDGPPQGNSQFKINSFYRELGIGTGFGLRFDFAFLIIRLDVGMKLYDPARAEGDRFVLNKAKFFSPFAIKNEDGSYSNVREPVIFNLGIGYPF